MIVATEHASIGHSLPLITVAPFVLLLGAIALLPLFCKDWWETNRNRLIVVLILSLPIVVYFATVWGPSGRHQLAEKACEYLSFMALLGSLYVISGGIHVRGTLAGTPRVNAGILALGAVIASFIGTTGASMLLVRPLLRANASRPRNSHTVVFFIFLVSNCGGLLTPLGDPPLYLGFLNGVPFEWTLRLWPPWLLVNGSLLAIYYVWDRIVWRRDVAVREPAPLAVLPPLVNGDAGQGLPQSHEPLRMEGWWNILFLFGIVAVICAGGNGLGTGGVPWKFPIPELLMAALGALAYLSTPSAIRKENGFNFDPIAEVAILFVGIFATMIPALLLLNANGPNLGLREPWQFFWTAGMLSSVLDNAPTYLTFAATACGLHGIEVTQPHYLAELLKTSRGNELLAAISCGAVFMGANTYIGNGPNLMVKTIADQSGVKMPGFFRYMLYSGCVLIPLFVVVTWLFFRP